MDRRSSGSRSGDACPRGGVGTASGRSRPWRRLRRWRARLARWRSREPGERRLLARAALLVLGFRIALRLLPFRRVMALADRMADGGRARHEGGRWVPGRGAGEGRRPRPVPRPDPRSVGREAETAARLLAAARPCLPQALACHVLLRRAGRAPTLHIGVRREGGDGRPPPATPPPEAHAWVECGGRVVAGAGPGEGTPSYARLLARSAGSPARRGR